MKIIILSLGFLTCHHQTRRNFCGGVARNNFKKGAEKLI
jgi:hypothetical protein